MTRPRGVRRLFRVPRFGRRQLECEVDDEIAFHIAERAERLRREGMSAADAYAEAARRFGDASAIRDECVNEDEDDLRRERLMDLFDHIVGDLRFAWRSLRRSPGFAIAAFLTLTLGIGALSSIFSLYNAAYHGTLPFHDADRLVAISEEHGVAHSFGYAGVSAAVLSRLRQPTRSFERVSATHRADGVVVFGGQPEGIAAYRVDTGFFALFAVRPEIGRLPSREEIAAGAAVAIISDQLWRAHYGGDSSVLHETIDIHQARYRIVGVAAPGFRFPATTDLFIPLPNRLDSAAVPGYAVDIVAKLRPGVSHAQARAELSTIGPQLARVAPPKERDLRLVVHDDVVDRRAEEFMPLPSLFLAAGALVLLIACANVGNLFYMRAAERRNEMAVRASLGGGQWRLVWQALTESLLLSTSAAAAGTLAAFALVKGVLAAIPGTNFPSWFHIAIDVRVLAFAIGIAVAATLVAGLAPAREAARFDLAQTLRGVAGVGSIRITRASRRGLVMQLAFSTALFVSGTLLLRSYQRLTVVDIGYPAARIAAVEPLYDLDRYPSVRQTQFALDIAGQAMAAPGISHVAVRAQVGWLRSVSDSASQHRRYDPRLIPDGDTSRAIPAPLNNDEVIVSEDYFNVLGLRIRAGRGFTGRDDESAAPVAVISSRAATLLWPHRSPIGHRVRVGIDGDEATVVGVVDDTRDIGFSAGRTRTSEPRATVYFSARQMRTWYPEVVAVGPGDVLAVRKLVVGLVTRADPALLVAREQTMNRMLDAALFETRIFGVMIGSLALSALALAVVGIYGVVGFGLAQRTREVGIRIALGATTAAIRRLLVWETARFAAIGIGVGLVLAVFLGRFVRIFLFGVSPLDRPRMSRWSWCSAARRAPPPGCPRGASLASTPSPRSAPSDTVS